jgi:hypothetical protein
MKRSKLHVAPRIALCAAVLSGILVTGATPASAECETIWVEAYTVTLDVGRRVYRVGDTARVEAKVTRNDTGAPVAGATFAALVPFRKTMLVDVDETNAAGRAVAELKLKKKSVRPGPARLYSIAYYEVADATCARLVEYGEKKLRKAFVIKP